MLDILSKIFYEPLYNALVFLIDVVPGGNVGVAIILLTILVKTVILPLSHKQIKAQADMRKMEPEMNEIRKKYTDKQEQARKIMELYQQHGMNPFSVFSGCLYIIIQIPIIFALYWVFFKGLPNLNADLLYAFVTLPETVNMHFLGAFNMTEKSILIALLAGISQYFQIKLSIPPRAVTQNKDEAPSLKEEFARNMNIQMRYVLPVFVFIIAYTISSAVALYWLTSNLFSIAHELLVKRKASAVEPA